MAKAVIGSALLAGAIALTVMSGGVGGVALIAASGELGALFAGVVLTAATVGAEMDLESIANALTNTPTTPQTVRSPSAPWHAIYGNVRTGGTQIDINSYGDNFKYCDMIIVLAAHPTVGVQLHTEEVGTSATFPSYGGLYINGQGMQWRNEAQGGSGVPGSIGYDLNQTPFGYTTSNNLQDLNQNHYSTGIHVYMEAYNGTGKSYQGGTLVNNQISTFYIANGPAGHWNTSCTMMYDLGTSVLTGGNTGAPIYANEQGVPKGYTYVYLRVLYASTLWSGGIPESLRFDIQGKNDIYDPRLNSGAGGYAYTNNSALVIADYMTNPYFGMGYSYSDFNIPALIAAANICDTSVPLTSGGSIAQYQINGAFDTSQNPSTILMQMLGTCDGDLSYVGGEWYIFPGTYVYPSAVITPSMLVGPLKVNVNQKPRDLFNSVKGSFICPAAIDTIGSNNIFLNEQPNIFNGQWQSQPFPPYAMDSQHGYSSDIWLESDGQKLYQEMSFPFTTSSALCQRLAKQALLKARTGNGLDDAQNRGLTFTVDCNLSAYNIVPHDTVWFSYPKFNWTAPPAGFSTSTVDIPEYTYTEFEVTNTQLEYRTDASGKPPVPVYTLTLRSTSPNIYLWNASDEIPMTENKYPQFANMMQIAPISNLVCESGADTVIASLDGHLQSSILCKWTAPNDGYVVNGGHIIVQILPVNPLAVTYTSLAGDNVITVSTSGIGVFSPGQQIVLAGAGTGGAIFTSVVFIVNGSTLTLINPTPTAVTHGVIQASGWITVATLAGNASSYSINGLSDGDQYYVQVYAINSARITSDADVAGPITVSTGQDTYADGLVVYAPGTTLAQIQAGASGNVLLQNSNFEAGNVGWTPQRGWIISSSYAANPHGGNYIGVYSGTNTSAMTNNQLIPCSAGNVLSASAYMKAADAGCTGALHVEILFYDSTGTLLSNPKSPSATINDWTAYRIVGTAPTNTSYAQIRAAIYSPTTTDWWGICGFSASLLANSLAEVPDGGGYNKLLNVSADNTLSASTALLPQGSILPINPFNVSFTTSTTSAGVSSVDFVWSSDVLEYPDGSTLTSASGSLVISTLSPATTYYVFPVVSTSTGVLSIYTPLPTTVSNAAVQSQLVDGMIAFASFSFTTPSTPSSGTSGGSGSGGGNVCPDADELVMEKTRGLIRVGDAQVGDELLGIFYDKQGMESHREYKRVTDYKTAYSETWYRVHGRKISPHHPIRFLDPTRSWHDEWLTPHEHGTLDTSPGTRVQLTLDTGDYNQANYVLHAVDGTPSIVMHNVLPPFPPRNC